MLEHRLIGLSAPECARKPSKERHFGDADAVCS